MISRVLFLIMVFVFLFPFSGNTQNIGVGVDVMYNFQTESLGAGARVNFFPNNRLSYVPQFSYYFPFNKVKEYYIGLGLEYKVIRRNKFNLYLIAHGAYNSWLSYEQSALKGAQQNNWNCEGGIGITNNRCLRPFLEYRYNIKFRETHLRLGLLYVFGCSGNGGGLHRKHSVDRCAAYGS